MKKKNLRPIEGQIEIRVEFDFRPRDQKTNCKTNPQNAEVNILKHFSAPDVRPTCSLILHSSAELKVDH